VYIEAVGDGPQALVALGVEAIVFIDELAEAVRIGASSRIDEIGLRPTAAFSAKGNRPALGQMGSDGRLDDRFDLLLQFL